MNSIVIILIILAIFPSISVLADCDFGYTSVKFCDWTPWSDFSCDGCCTGQTTSAVRSRGLCCTGSSNDCFFACGIDVNTVVKSESANCSSCVCPGDTTTVAAPSGYICYRDSDDVSKCGQKCTDSWEWGQCIRDCSVDKAETLCTILDVSLFFLGLAIGITLTALLACLLYRRKRKTWEKRRHSSMSQRSTMMTLNNDGPYNSYTGVYDTKRGLPPSYHVGNRMKRVHEIPDGVGRDGYNFAGRNGQHLSMGNRTNPPDSLYAYRSNPSGRVPSSARPSMSTVGIGQQSDEGLNNWLHL